VDADVAVVAVDADDAVVGVLVVVGAGVTIGVGTAGQRAIVGRPDGVVVDVVTPGTPWS